MQILGTIIVSSSLAGETRVKRWEASVLSLLNPRLILTKLTQWIVPRTKKVFSALLYPATIIGLILFIISVICDYRSSYQLINLLLETLSRHFGFTGVPINCLKWMFAIFLSIMAVLSVVAAIFCGIAFGFSDIFGSMISGIICIVIFGIVITFLGIMYFGVFVLLSPYLLADQITIRFKLQTTLGVLGTLLIILGQFLS